MKKILFIYGTRPEAIKMAPLVRKFQEKASGKISVEVCLTGQHRSMLDQVNSFFKIDSQYDLNLMRKNQSLHELTARCISGVQKVLEQSKPDLVFVQGDTSTVLAGAIASFYSRVPIAHLEAGLRSHDIMSPFPEEGNRKLVGHIAKYHFVPTQTAKQNLVNENISENIHIVGNTVIDALHLGLELIESRGSAEYEALFPFIDNTKKIVLVTGHRRESFGSGFEGICNALKIIAEKNSDIQIIYPVHLNPNVQEPVYRLLSENNNIHLVEPVDYPVLLWLMRMSYLVLTDSGGIQEEAPALGKPVLVMRDVTERTEGIEAGTALLVGTEPESIIENVNKLLSDTEMYSSMSKAVNPYGDGTTSSQIVDILMKELLG